MSLFLFVENCLNAAADRINLVARLNVYGEIDSLDFEFAEKYFLENGPDWDDYGEERVVEYYEAYFKCSANLQNELLARFKDCVGGRI